MERGGEFRERGPVAADRLGDRAVARGEGTTVVESFAVCRELSERPEFCAAMARVRDTGARSARGLARVLGIDLPAAKGERVVVRQEWTPGERLSDVASRRRRLGRGFTVGHALFVLRECAGALRALHAGGTGTCHGAITAERILITADDRIVLCEAVLGPGLGALADPADWFGSTLGLEVPQVPGVPAFTPLTDQYQLGRLVVELLGGTAAATSSAGRLEQLEALNVVGPDGIPVPVSPLLRTLLARMLLVSPEGPFRSMTALERALEAVVTEAACGEPGPPPIEVPEPVLPPVAPSSPASTFIAVVPDQFPLVSSDPSPVAVAVGPAPADASPWSHGPEPAPSLRLVDTAPVPVPLPVPLQAQPAAPAYEHGQYVPLGGPIPEHVPIGLAPARRADTGTHKTQLAEATPLLDYADLQSPAMGLSPVFVPRSLPAAQAVRPRSRWKVWAVAAAVLAVAAAAGAWFLWPLVMAGDAPTGWLRLESKPSGADVTVNGQPKGRTPLTLSLPAAAYVVEFALDGQTRSLTVPVTAQGEAYQLVSLYPPGPPGIVSVESIPSGAAVSLDGVVRGRTPLAIAEVAPGEHTLRLENGAARVERTLEVLAGARVDVSLPLSGSLIVESPIEVSVKEGATELGQSTAGAIAVGAGTRRLTFLNATLNYEDTREVEVMAGQVTRVVLKPPTGVINLDADTSAQVFLDGRPLGLTPLSNVQVALGSHEVTFRDSRGGEVRYLIVVAVGPAYRLKAALVGKPPTSAPVRRR